MELIGWQTIPPITTTIERANKREHERVGRTHRHEHPGIEFGGGVERHMTKQQIDTAKGRAPGEKGRQRDIRHLKVRGIRAWLANCSLNLWNL